MLVFLVPWIQEFKMLTKTQHSIYISQRIFCINKNIFCFQTHSHGYDDQNRFCSRMLYGMSPTKKETHQQANGISLALPTFISFVVSIVLYSGCCIHPVATRILTFLGFKIQKLNLHFPRLHPGRGGNIPSFWGMDQNRPHTFGHIKYGDIIHFVGQHFLPTAISHLLPTAIWVIHQNGFIFPKQRWTKIFDTTTYSHLVKYLSFSISPMIESHVCGWHSYFDIQHALPETNIAPENWCLEDDPFLLGRPIFRCELLVFWGQQETTKRDSKIQFHENKHFPWLPGWAQTRGRSGRHGNVSKDGCLGLINH